MSLASVHILFITMATLLAIAAGAWGVSAYASAGDMTGLVWGVLSLLAVPVLLVYGVKVRRKLKALGSVLVMTRVRSLTVAAAAWILLLLPISPAAACSVCFGDPNSAETKGLRAAIVFLLILVGFVQIGFLRLFWGIRQRSKLHDERKKRFSVVRGGLRT